MGQAPYSELSCIWESRKGQLITHEGPTDDLPEASADAAALAAFLRRLAEAIERDDALGRHLAEVARESGLLAAAPTARPAVSERRTRRAGAAAAAGAPPDPFALLRERGEPGLRAALAELNLAALRAIIRTHRLDPARIAARWTARDRLVDLIAEQVRARASHGRAFERV